MTGFSIDRPDLEAVTVVEVVVDSLGLWEVTGRTCTGPTMPNYMPATTGEATEVMMMRKENTINPTTDICTNKEVLEVVSNNYMENTETVTEPKHQIGQ